MACNCNCNCNCDPCACGPTPSVQVTRGVPVGAPPKDGHPLAFDAATGTLYLYLEGTGWTAYAPGDPLN